ncbi:MAG: ROK family protein [Verrucomicrobiota bacterium]
MKFEPCHVLGIDVGGTKIAAGVVGFPEGQIHTRHIIPTLPHRRSDAVLKDLVSLVEKIIQQARTSGVVIDGIGLGLCELVGLDGTILSGHTLSWRTAEVQEALGQFGLVTIEADVRAAALAEAIFGAGLPYSIFVYVTIGTGISSCLVLDGQPFPGARGATGTIASSVIALPCQHCGDINRLSIEEIASGPALFRRFQQRQPDQCLSAEDVLLLANEGHRDALAVVHSAANALGSTLAQLVNVLDPEALVLGGGLGLSQGVFQEELERSTRAAIWAGVNRNLPIVQASTGTDAGVIGAAAAWRAKRKLR